MTDIVSLTRRSHRRRVIRTVRVVVESALTPADDLLRGIAEYAHTRTDWHLLIEQDQRAAGNSEWLKDDGLIYGFARITPAAAEFAKSGGLPVVGTYLHISEVTTATVTVDDHAIGVAAADYFSGRGLRNVAFEAYADRSTSAVRRFEGFVERSRKLGLTLHMANAAWLDGVTPASSHHRPDIIDLVMKCPKPLGMFCTHDNLARLTCEHLRAARIPVPNTVAILGCDNNQLISSLASPAISSINCGWERVGFHAAQTLDAIFNGHAVADRITLLAPLGIEERQSTKVLGVDSMALAQALQFIEDHACDPCTVDDLIDSVPQVSSRRWLETSFQKHLGRTPKEAITHVRMQRARMLLASTSMKLDIIARRCGYGLVHNFSRAFRQENGVPPATYRRDVNRHPTILSERSMG